MKFLQVTTRISSFISFALVGVLLLAFSVPLRVAYFNGIDIDGDGKTDHDFTAREENGEIILNISSCRNYNGLVVFTYSLTNEDTGKVYRYPVARTTLERGCGEFVRILDTPQEARGEHMRLDVVSTYYPNPLRTSTKQWNSNLFIIE